MEGFAADLVRVVREELAAVAPGRLAVAVTSARVAEIVAILRSSGVDAIDPRDSDSRGLSADLVVIGAEGSNGLEFDGIVVVEPLEIAARGNAVMRPTPRGLRTLYVALTRPTRRLALVHALDLPPTLL
jgi:DNA helicase IV